MHPDKNMGNEKAAEAFKKLQNAYEVSFDDSFVLHSLCVKSAYQICIFFYVISYCSLNLYFRFF